MHGFALNVSCALERFGPIVPCGLQGVEMVSMESLLGRAVSLADVRERVADALREELS
jgi:lipoyl(octanoyl) transferase